MTASVPSRPIFARLLARGAVLEERRGGAEHRRRLLAGLRGRVIEVGVGSGLSFAHYPQTVTELRAIEPEPHLRAMAQEAARDAPIAVRVLDGVADRLPADDGAMDAGVVTGVLCSVPDPLTALRELARVIRPGGELRFYEHVAARAHRLALLQRALDATLWPRLNGGCHTTRDTEAAIVAAGFAIEERERFSFRVTALAAPVAPRILGRARRPAQTFTQAFR
jgi:ubiquinone/menaquinone biosynthesis C-methylase UbiE